MVLELETDDAVIGLRAQRFHGLEDPGLDPLIAMVADRGGRTAAIGDAFVGSAEQEDLDELVDDDPIRDAWVVTAPRVGVDVFGEQRGELVPDRFDDAGWQGKHAHLAEE